MVVTLGAFSAGFECSELDLLLISGEEFFTTGIKKSKIKNKLFKDSEKVVFADLIFGDFVVHKLHGIGQFVGINTIKTKDVTKDYIKIKYKGEDTLYIPTDQLDSIRKYIGPRRQYT